MEKYYHASNYEEFCPHCDNTINYSAIYGDKTLTKKDFKPFNCPSCKKQLYPCDLCYDVNEFNCDGCPFE